MIDVRKSYAYINIYIKNQLNSTKDKKGGMENTQIQYQARYKNSHLILEHAYDNSQLTINDTMNNNNNNQPMLPSNNPVSEVKNEAFAEVFML